MNSYGEFSCFLSQFADNSYSNITSDSPQKEFVVKVILGEKIDFLQLKKAEAIIVDKFNKHGISISEDDIKIKHKYEASIEKVISNDDDDDDDSYGDFSDDYDNSISDPYYAKNVSHLKDNDAVFEMDLNIKLVSKVINLFFLYAVVKNVNYDKQMADLAALKAQKEKEEKEYNSIENVKRRRFEKKVKDQREKFNKSLKAIANIETNPKALESVIKKHGQNWKAIMLAKWNSKSK